MKDVKSQLELAISVDMGKELKSILGHFDELRIKSENGQIVRCCVTVNELVITNHITTAIMQFRYKHNFKHCIIGGVAPNRTFTFLKEEPSLAEA